MTSIRETLKNAVMEFKEGFREGYRIATNEGKLHVVVEVTVEEKETVRKVSSLLGYIIGRLVSLMNSSTGKLVIKLVAPTACVIMGILNIILIHTLINAQCFAIPLIALGVLTTLLIFKKGNDIMVIIHALLSGYTVAMLSFLAIVGLIISPATGLLIAVLYLVPAAVCMQTR